MSPRSSLSVIHTNLVKLCKSYDFLVANIVMWVVI